MNFKYCMNCRKKIPINTVFCPYCGYRQSQPLNNKTPIYTPKQYQPNNVTSGFVFRWKHFWTNWPAWKIILIGIFCLSILGIFGIDTYTDNNDDYPSYKLPDIIAYSSNDIDNRDGSEYDIKTNDNSFVLSNPEDVNNNTTKKYYVDHVSYDGSHIIHVTCHSPEDNDSSSHFTFHIKGTHIIKAQEKGINLNS